MGTGEGVVDTELLCIDTDGNKSTIDILSIACTDPVDKLTFVSSDTGGLIKVWVPEASWPEATDGWGHSNTRPLTKA